MYQITEEVVLEKNCAWKSLNLTLYPKIDLNSFEKLHVEIPIKLVMEGKASNTLHQTSGYSINSSPPTLMYNKK